jgi:hypothetical protein
MKKTLLCIALGTGALIALPASAATTIVDTYIGNNGNDTSANTDDYSLTSEPQYNMESMTASITPTTLTVSIKATEYHNSSMAGAGINNSYFKHWYTDATNFFPGDLFISTNGWHPYSDASPGAGAPAYGEDHDTNGEIWEYAVHVNNLTADFDDPLTNNTKNLSGSTGLFLTPGDDNDDFNIREGSLRSGQVAYLDYDYANGAGMGAGSWAITDSNGNGVLDTMTYTMALAGIDFNESLAGIQALTDGQQLGLHWTMSCANDVMQGGVAVTAVPEPETYAMLLAGLGLVGFAARRRRMM